MRIIAKWDPNPTQPAGAAPAEEALYPFHRSSWVISVALHGLAFFLIAIIPSVSTSSQNLLPDPEAIQPLKIQKVIFYRFPPKLPDVASERRIRKSPTPRGLENTPNTIVARARKAPSKRQMIWRPAPQFKLRLDVPAPNVVLSMATQVLVPPAPPVTKPLPAVGQQPAAAIREAPNKPPPAVSKAVPKTFVAPPRRVREPRLATPALFDDQAPAIKLSDPQVNSPFSRISGIVPVGAPPSPAPPSETAKAGNAKVDIAVVGLRPVKSARELPDGERAAQFSKAPAKGATASGSPDKSADIVVPNLTVRNEDPTAAKLVKELPVGRRVLYSDRLRNVSSATFSVPLRPSTRTIPRAVEARFRGRNVYTMVIPIENFPNYSGDWILWFAEEDPMPAQSAAAVRAPVPFRKLEPVEDANQGPVESQRAQVSAIVRRDGRLESIALLTKSRPAVAEAFIRDLMSWEFKPATRNSIPIEVEVVLEIPLNVPSSLASRQP